MLKEVIVVGKVERGCSHWKGGTRLRLSGDLSLIDIIAIVAIATNKGLHGLHNFIIFCIKILIINKLSVYTCKPVNHHPDQLNLKITQSHYRTSVYQKRTDYFIKTITTN